MVAGAAQGRTLPLFARAAPGRGRPLAPGPVPALGLGLLVLLVLVLAHPDLAPVPRRTLRIPEAVVCPDPIAGAVEAIVGMTSGTADLAHHIQKMYDDRMTQLPAAAFCHTSLKFIGYVVVVYWLISY